MSKITFYPLIVVLLLTGSGFYFLYSQKAQLATDVDLLKDQVDIIKKENRNLNIRIRALEDSSIKNMTQRASKTIQQTVDTVLNAIDQRVEEARRLNEKPQQSTENDTDTTSGNPQ